MDLHEVMKKHTFVILGDTQNKEKYAYKIKAAMLEAGYQVYAVPKEFASINDVPGDIEMIDLCIHPVKGLKLLKECHKSCEGVVIQPGAENEQLLNWLENQNIPYLRSCLLKGLDLYGNK